MGNHYAEVLLIYWLRLIYPFSTRAMTTCESNKHHKTDNRTLFVPDWPKPNVFKNNVFIWSHMRHIANSCL